MENIPRSTQCVQQYPTTTSLYFTAEELAAPAEVRVRPPARRAATCCETCGEVTSDLFGVNGTDLCADCAAGIWAVL